MNNIFVIIYKVTKRALMFFHSKTCAVYTWIKLKGNGVKFSSVKSNGIPMIDVQRSATMIIGKNFCMNNGKYYNKIGRQQPCMFIVTNGGVLSIGNNVGISASAFVCSLQISIGNHVKIGGNCVFYDTDFHSLNYLERREKDAGYGKCRSKPITIEEDVFIGAHSTILKGVTIGKGSIIGAGSVVSKSVPPGEIWGGNPATFIRFITN